MDAPAPADTNRSATDPQDSVIPVAVIDVGTASIRMAIAEIGPGDHVRPLERLSQAVSLGRDTFTKGIIEKPTIEECVRVLKSYRQVLREYQIVQDDRIRIVATSAVREAGNRMAFLDRVYSATGMRIEPIDEAEVNRITYLGIQPFLRSEEALARANTVIIEVGGGSTELLLVQQGEVAYSRTFRLGSLRLRQMLDSYRAPAGKVRSIMESQIRRTVEEVVQHVPRDGTVEMIALGGDIRFAANQILPDWNRNELATVPVAELETFTDRVLTLSEDRLIQQYHLTYRDTEMRTGLADVSASVGRTRFAAHPGNKCQSAGRPADRNGPSRNLDRRVFQSGLAFSVEPRQKVRFRRTARLACRRTVQEAVSRFAAGTPPQSAIRIDVVHRGTPA